MCPRLLTESIYHTKYNPMNQKVKKIYEAPRQTIHKMELQGVLAASDFAYYAAFATYGSGEPGQEQFTW